MPASIRQEMQPRGGPDIPDRVDAVRPCRVEVRHLRYFVAVAEELHFSRAAARLFMAQPALSHAIRSLERELGVRLFDRTTRSVALTPAGAELLAGARTVLARLAEALLDARAAAAAPAPPVRLAVSPDVQPVIGPLLDDLLDASPSRVDIALTTDADALEGLQAGRLDGALCWGLGQDDARLTRYRLHDEPFRAVVPAGHRLHGHGPLDRAQVMEDAFVLPARRDAPALWDRLAEAVGGGRPPVDGAEVRSRTFEELVRTAVRRNELALVPRSFASGRRSPQYDVRPLRPDLSVPVELVTVSDAPAHVRRLAAAAACSGRSSARPELALA
jgi:DNA-binding transcriptional LysR family regulator